MKKHTPGPWMVQNGKIIEKCYNGFVIADVRGATEVMQDEANARLIAAAPELLEAAVIAQLVLFSLTPIQYDEKFKEQIQTLGKAQELLIAAINKAQGRE